MMRSWAQFLTIFSSDQLAPAFAKVAMTSRGWPTTGDICDAIFTDEFANDLAFLLGGIRKFGPEWKNIPESRGPSRLGTTIHDRIPGDLIPEVPAPTIPARLRRALEIYGTTGHLTGLDRLYRHPAAGGFSGDMPHVAAEAIERGFKAAWLAARKSELAGGE